MIRTRHQVTCDRHSPALSPVCPVVTGDSPWQARDRAVQAGWDVVRHPDGDRHLCPRHTAPNTSQETAR